MTTKQQPTGKTPALVTIDSEILEALQEYKSKQGLNNSQLAKRLGISETYASRAFSGQFTGSKVEFEDKARALLHAATQAHRAPLVKLRNSGFLVQPMRNFLATVQHTQDIGVAWCDAGKGKTCGIALYQQAEPLCIVVTAKKSCSGWHSIRNAVLNELPQKRRQKGESWDYYLQRTFHGSGRLLVIDNAHLITESARQWLAYDWHEQTGCPVALVGNPDIVRQWKANDQHHSRVGLAFEVKPAASVSAHDTARATFELLLPEAAQDARTLKMAENVIRSKGAARSLRKHAQLTRELMQAPEYQGKPIADVFKAAHGLLLSEAKLEAAA